MNTRSVIRIITVICLVAVVALALNAWGLLRASGSGNIVSELRTVNDFHAINFSGIGEVTISQGDVEALTVETDSNLLPYIETTVRQGVLTIALSDDRPFSLIRPSEAIRYQLTVKTLDALTLTGAGTVKVKALETSNLVLENSGAGTITFVELQADTLTVNLSGVGQIVVAGKVMAQSMELSGIGTYNAGDLASQRATVELSGAGDATVWVSDELDANISGAGSIAYYGSPQLNANQSGIGKVERLGDKSLGAK